MQSTCFLVNKVIQWYKCGKTVPIFYKQTEVGDSWCENASTLDEKSKLLYSVCAVT